ncbi:MAG: translational GTPase TypA, partial [Acidobacteriota bacterium]|nr:translational GTPase TypA [Acidobacteriota bacterium]
GRDGWAVTDLAAARADLSPLFDLIVAHVPSPQADPDAPFAMLATTLDYDPFLGRVLTGLIHSGVARLNMPVKSLARDGRTIEQARLTKLLAYRGLERRPIEEARAGDIIAVAGIPEITIGDTLADAEDPRALPPITVDEPSLSVTVGTNDSPLAGQDGDKLTASQLKARLERELVGNVSLRVNPTERPDVWEVQGRGELALAVLVEVMRREGFELTVGKPQVVTRELKGKLHEPMERMSVDTPEEYVGVITQMLALRKGRMEQMINHGTGWVRMEYIIPARGLIGFRTEFLTETRGTGLVHHVFDRWEPWQGEIRTRGTGSLVADRRGRVAAFALFNLQERGSLFVGPGEEVYEGMVVGENSRADDLDVNAVKEKHLTNMRSS